MILYTENFNTIRQEEQEKELYMGYQIASLTASFVNRSMSGKPIPDFYQIYPSLRKVTDEEKSMRLYQEMFTFYAEAHNKNRHKKGD